LLFIGLLIFFAFYIFGTMHVHVDNISMTPTFQEGQKLLLLKSNICKFKKNDIVVFKAPDKSDEFYLKRIVAVQNDIVEIDKGALLINGINDDTNLIFGKMPNEEFYYKVETNRYFMLSDNRKLENVKDSRNFGSIEKKNIIGKVILKLK